MKKRILCLVLVLGMLLAFAACSGTAPEASTAPSATSSPTATAAPSEPTAEIEIFTFAYGTYQDVDKVMDEVNKTSIPEINTKAHMTMVNSSAYKEQTNLMLASQDNLDLFWTGTIGAFFDYAGQIGKGQLYALNDLLDQYGANIKEVLGDFVEASRFKDGKIYALTTRRDLAKSACVIISKEYVEKYGLDVSGVKKAEDLDPIFQKVHAADPDLYLIANDRTAGGVANYLGNNIMMDSLGSGDACLLEDPTQSLTITLFPDSDAFKATVQQARDWYVKGYISKDAATDTTSGLEYFKAGRMFSLVSAYKAGQESQVLTQTSKESIIIQTHPFRVDTNTTINYMWGIPVFSKNPEAAMKFLNLMYGSKDVINLLAYGIEGVQYKKVDDSHIDFADGVTAQTSSYNPTMNWCWGDQFKTYYWKGADTKLFEQMEYDNTHAVVSKGTGFLFDTSSVKTEYAAVLSVINEFDKPLNNGVLDPATGIPQYVAKLKNVGVEKILAEKQKQLNEWKG